MSDSMTVHEDDFDAMVRGDWYRVGPRLEERAARARRLQAEANACAGVDEERMRRALGELFGELGDGAVVRPPVHVDYGENIRLGAHTFVNYDLIALDCAPITIGEGCLIGPRVQLLTPEHPLDPAARMSWAERAKPITLGRDVWLGGGVTIVGGVTIGDHAVIGAGSVVTKDVPPYAVAVGSPARVIRMIDPEA